MQEEFDLDNALKRIVIIGPESTGKSTLTTGLAGYFHTAHVPEYARLYLEQLDRPYTAPDLEAIARGQIALEDKTAAAAGGDLLFCDTDLQVVKVWSEDKYNHCPAWILEAIAMRPYDLYLLTDIDMPWQDDPLREHPEPQMRAYFFHIYKDIVQQSGIPFVLVTGNEQQRLECAVAAIQQVLL
ncbi:AAA family ATPase [Taibaiella chishuiensis]|uniref:NadR type nicotinamide-nucleotide adenylyltransferase n=1 Tax=Taibaiella chishuiensis TaxID=1434707 RepID=A0A2P8D9I4_9BACT|nr:ATP-binding protein [Taibaiella chishuiensis]PSK93863.1 NadR type nicotinamide-nucleotide adenylyltransferase [Taibaiella chishuiensis]